MKSLLIFIFIGTLSLSLSTIANAEVQNTEQLSTQEQSQAKYQEPTTGVEIIFSQNADTWDKIMANGESELVFGDRSDVRQATSKAILRAKASIAKFFNEKLTSNETIEEISKVITSKKSDSTNVSINAGKNSAETLVEQISNSANAILKGVIVLEQNINRKEKYVSVKLGISRKTMKTADTLSKATRTDLSQRESSSLNNSTPSDNGKNEIRRSRNYDNF